MLDHAQLEAHARRMRALAVSLVGPDDADDVVQDAWVSALSRPPRRAGALGPWLAGVVRNAGRMWRRTEGRRRRREARVEPRPEPAGPPTAAARAELAERLARAVRSLPEPYREVVVLRVYEGLPPREVARRTGAAVETVRTRYRRALERLRAHLDAESASHRRPWLPAVALAWGLRAPPRLPASTTALTLGTLAMKKSALLVGFLILACVGGGVVLTLDAFRDDGPGAADDASYLARREEAAGADAADATLEGRAAPGGLRGAQVGAPDAASDASADLEAPRGEAWLDAYRAKTGPQTFEGLVLVDAQPVTEGRVLVQHVGRTEETGPLDPDAEDVEVLPIGPEGRFRLDPVGAPGPTLLRVEVHVPGQAPRRLTEQIWNLTGERRFVRLGTAVLEGEVRGAGGHPVFEAQVVARWAGARADGLLTTAATSSRADGTYRIEGLAAGPYEVVVTFPSGEGEEPAVRRVATHLDVGARVRVDVGEGARDPLLAGTVRTAWGEPVRGPGRLLLEPTGGGGEAFAIEFDAWGRYRAPVRPGPHRVKVQAPGWDAVEAPVVAPSFVVAADDLVQDVTLPGLRVTGEVRNAATGELVEHARVTWKPKDASHPGAFHHIEAEDGEYVIDGLSPDRTWEVWATDSDGAGVWATRRVIEVLARRGETVRRLELRTAAR